VTELQKYLAEEVAEDVADGILTRREAMQRLGVLGFTASAAAAMLAAKAEARRPPRGEARVTAVAVARPTTGRRSTPCRSPSRGPAAS
jgi:carboxymethylenebutenolidase